MSNKYEPERDIDTVPVSSVKGDNQPVRQEASHDKSTVVTTFVMEHLTVKQSDRKSNDKDD